MCATTRSATCCRASTRCRASTSCSRWAGTPSACRPRTPRSRTTCRRPAWTYSNIDYMKQPAQVARLRHRLGTRTRHLHARVLPLGAVAVHPPLRKRPDLQEARHRELGSGRSDRARQRAGHRRPRLAFRRADREARDPDVLHEDHRLRRRTADRPRQPAGLAGAGQADAEELDRQEHRRALRLPAGSTMPTKSCGCSPPAPTPSWA